MRDREADCPPGVVPDADPIRAVHEALFQAIFPLRRPWEALCCILSKFPNGSLWSLRDPPIEAGLQPGPRPVVAASLRRSQLQVEDFF